MMSYVSVSIPEPSADFLTSAARPLAVLTFDFGVMEFWWWTDEHKVLVRCAGPEYEADAWYLQPDMKIEHSVGELLDKEYYMTLESMMLFKDDLYRHGKTASEQLRHDFFKCEWSDYACDSRPVSATVVLREIPSCCAHCVNLNKNQPTENDCQTKSPRLQISNY